MTATQPIYPQAPLLRAIAREIIERTHAATDLERRLTGFGDTRRAHAEEVTRIEARLAAHRQALRQVERELHGLGWVRDASRPLGFRRRDDDDGTWRPERTGFFRALGDVAA